MLASWRGARLEVSQVLREVLDNVLKEPGVPEEVLMNRAKVTLPTLCAKLALTDAVPRPCLSPARSSSLRFPTSPTKNAGSLSGRLFLTSREILPYTNFASAGWCTKLRSPRARRRLRVPPRPAANRCLRRSNSNSRRKRRLQKPQHKRSTFPVVVACIFLPISSKCRFLP